MNLRNWTIRTRLGLGFGTLALIVFVVSALSVWNVSVEHEAFTRYVTETETRQQLVTTLLHAANGRAIAARNLVLVTEGADRDSELAATNRAHEAMGRAMTELKATLGRHAGVTDEERQLFSAIESVESKYSVVALRIVGLASKGQRDEAIRQMNADCRPLLAALVAAAEKYGQYGQQVATAEIGKAEHQFQTNRALLAGGCVVALLGAAGLGFGLTRSITRPIERAVHLARTVAAGDLSSSIETDARDETGQLLAALKAMNDSLSGIVANVRQTSDSIATGSAQIASGNADLSQRTERQAANLQQTAASMEQMTASVRHSAETAQQASQLAGAASAAAERGGEVVSEVVSTMAAITDSSRRIADIIGVIDGIAFQTNILALNAAVEAARAGEQGRGFAVVAGEVRALAQRCASAAREIKDLIGASVERIETGSRQAGSAGDAMQDIVVQVKRVADLIGDISAAAGEQTGGIGQVNDAVASLDEATQQNAALVEESAAAADSLSRQAAVLSEAVRVFKVA